MVVTSKTDVGGALGANNGRILLDYLGGEGQEVFGGRLPSGILISMNNSTLSAARPVYGGART